LSGLGGYPPPIGQCDLSGSTIAGHADEAIAAPWDLSILTQKVIQADFRVFIHQVTLTLPERFLQDLLGALLGYPKLRPDVLEAHHPVAIGARPAPGFRLV
jgi:hypothetical protein